MTKILIADDDIHHIKIYAIHFQKAGFNVLIATDGHQAVEMVKAHKPKLVFMDMLMPILSGLEALEKIKSNEATRSTPIIMLSVITDEINAEKALLKGAIGYITKLETSPEDIVNKAKEILGTSEKPYDPLDPIP